VASFTQCNFFPVTGVVVLEQWGSDRDISERATRQNSNNSNTAVYGNTPKQRHTKMTIN